MEFTFYVQGSAAEPYELTFNANDGFAASCSCPAGENRMLCKHILSLLEGDFSNVTIGEPADLSIAYELFSKSEVKSHYDEWQKYVVELATLQKMTADNKRKLARILLGR
ncbi:MAG: SWIM zinc finger domain-containing protein [Oscillospiraceae bacterium]|nr:SWIM zinc finger domain-containing protein [Oscillospiraceae bacterium]